MGKQKFTLSAGDFTANFTADENGLSVISLYDNKSKQYFLQSVHPLFYFKTRKFSDLSETKYNSCSGFAVDADKTENGYRFKLQGGGELDGVRFIIEAAAEADKFTFETTAESDSEDFALLTMDHPNLWFDKSTDLLFFYPYGSGEYKNSAIDGGFFTTQNYPSYGASMQYLAVWDEKLRRGIYCGAHDPAPANKYITCGVKNGESAGKLAITQPLSGISKPKSSQKLPGCFVWQIFDGDWYDAAMLYRGWVQKEASWLPERLRPDSPEWLHKLPHWWLHQIKEEDFADKIIKSHKDLGVQSALHLYWWHKIPFDNDYPHYFPVIECLTENLTKLKNAGIKIMPYINGRLWDTHDRDCEDWKFTAEAYKSCTKDINGKPFTETYNARESNGEKVELAVMCPSEELWQNKMAEITDRVFNEVGFDALYVDQIAAARATPCEDPAHSHPSGCGVWWCEEYEKLISKMKNTAKNPVLTTECTADPFMKHMNAYLSWLWVKAEQVPAFSAIYNDYIVSFGIHYGSLLDYTKTKDLHYAPMQNSYDPEKGWIRDYNKSDFPPELLAYDETGVRIFAAQSLVYGEQMGWLRPEAYDNFGPQLKAFYQLCVRERAGLTDEFDHATLLRPPYITDDAPRQICLSANEAYGKKVDYAAVCGGLFEINFGANKGRRLLIYVNSADRAAAVKTTAEVPDGEYNANTAEKIVFINGIAEFTMQPLSVLWMII